MPVGELRGYGSREQARTGHLRQVIAYSDDDHIVRELGEPPSLDQTAIHPARDGRAGPGARK